jgi:hypothetical protein
LELKKTPINESLIFRTLKKDRERERERIQDVLQVLVSNTAA